MALHGRSQLTMLFLHRRQWRNPVLCFNTTPKFRPSARLRYKRFGSSYGGLPAPGQVGPQLEADEEVEGKSPPREDEQAFRWRFTLFKMIESAATTFMSITVLGLVSLESAKHQTG